MRPRGVAVHRLKFKYLTFEVFSEHDENEIANALIARWPSRHGGDRKSDQGGNISTLNDEGKTRDLAAAKVGLGSGKTYEAAKRVVENGIPKLVEAMGKSVMSLKSV